MSSERPPEGGATTTHDLDPGSYTTLRLVCVSIDSERFTSLMSAFSSTLHRSISIYRHEDASSALFLRAG